jgi:hypothetical protein
MTASTIQPDRILHELSELWVSFGKQNGDDSSGVLRACAMTLVVLADAGGGCQSNRRNPRSPDARASQPRHRRARERFAGARPRSPRVRPMLDAFRTAPPDLLRADRDFLFDWFSRGCAGSGATVSRCRSPGDSLVAPAAPARHSRLARSRRIATKTIIDSAPFPDPREALQRLARATASGSLLADWPGLASPAGAN